jgi:hypothetical protein
MTHSFLKLRRRVVLWNIKLDINANRCYEADCDAGRGKTELTWFQLPRKQHSLTELSPSWETS